MASLRRRLSVAVAFRRRPAVLGGCPRSLAAAACGWNHLLRHQDDPEKRIAELEHQLAEALAPH